ncbi:fidgetin-like protein 1 [Scaptodrosophila lebanonensis]|uniref:Fidgetin-like protein 1 n=1 Tax=Drosophila lebanonensis TaxID=7225 RepID=A0A6J2UA29_DROLE|nr:fidgetin-like protein 1 [Scaptodrosophila lebanonensis]
MIDEQWSDEFAMNQEVWESNEANASNKMNAWRKQKLLLQHALRNQDDAMHCAVLEDHHDKMDQAACTAAYFEERLANCQNLLAHSRRSRNGTEKLSMPMQWTIPEPSVFESKCRGKYQSCQYDEITNEELLEISRNIVTDNNSFESENLSTSSTFKSSFGSSNATTSRQPLAAVEADSESTTILTHFRTAREELILQELQKRNQGSGSQADMIDFRKRTLGLRRNVRANFAPPVARDNAKEGSLTLDQYVTVNKQNSASGTAAAEKKLSSSSPSCTPPSIDPKMVEQIMGEIMHKYKPVDWDDIAGLKYAKDTIKEAIIFPLIRPEIFTGLRRPPRGILLFGPPGTGKTLIAKCIASQAKATFFSINPSTLTSKWIGEGEKLVKTMFAVATEHQPAVIFMDEVDSLLSQRSDTEHESSRRLKNEFFIQLDGAATNEEDRIVIIGATNRPQELDEAVRRRFVRRLYVPLPEMEARKQIIEKLIREVDNCLTQGQIQHIAELTEGYSGADIDSLCRDAALEPVRSISSTQMNSISAEQLRAVTMADFKNALQHVSPSVSPNDIEQYVTWNKTYGARP